MNIDSIKNGIVIDHITAGKGMELYKLLGLDSLDCSVALIKSSGIPHEFRTTAVKGLHTPEDFEKIGKWLDGEPYYLQAFVDSGDILGGENGFSAFSADEMKRLAASCGASVRGVG